MRLLIFEGRLRGLFVVLPQCLEDLVPDQDKHSSPSQCKTRYNGWIRTGGSPVNPSVLQSPIEPSRGDGSKLSNVRLGGSPLRNNRTSQGICRSPNALQRSISLSPVSQIGKLRQRGSVTCPRSPSGVRSSTQASWQGPWLSPLSRTAPPFPGLKSRPDVAVIRGSSCPWELGTPGGMNVVRVSSVIPGVWWSVPAPGLSLIEAIL